MSYIDTIKARARLDKKTIVLPETTDKRTLIAAAKIMEEGIANIIMIGDEEKIMDGAGWLEVDLTGVEVINPKSTDKLDAYVNLLYETRKAKGMTPEKAREILLSDPLTFGIVMVKANDADGMVAGACHSTADTLRPALQILKTAPGVKLVSAFFCDGYSVQGSGRGRYVYLCRLRFESGSHGGGTGGHRRDILQKL